MSSRYLVRRWVAMSATLLLAACSSPRLTEPAAPLRAVQPTTTSVSPSTSPPAVTTTTETETTKTVTEVVVIPYATRTVEDALMETGRTVLRTAGRAGSKTVTWTVRTRGGVEIGRTVSGEKVTKAPVDEVTAVGTKVAAPAVEEDPADPADTGDCDSNYAGACVPIASDVDCAGGKGNGPAYVRGPVQVVGRDVYGLDADHDGIGCE